MSVFLLVLKIIGIVLLCIVLLALLILIGLLFAPFRYQANVEGNKEGPYVKAFAKVRWLFVSGSYDFLLKGENELVIRLFGIPIKRKKQQPDEDKDSEEKDEEKAESKNDNSEEVKSDEADSEVKAEDKPSEKEEDFLEDKPSEKESGEAEEDTSEDKSEESDTETSENASEVEDSGENSDEATDENDNDAEEPAEKVKLVQKVKNKFGSVKNKVADKFNGVKTKISSLWDSVRAMFILFGKKKGLLQKYIEKKSTRNAIKTAWDNVYWVLKHIAPKKYNGEVEFGLADPALTGEIYAGISPLYGFVSDHLVLTPAFENELVVDGNASIKGRIRLWGILIRAIRLYRDKNIRKVIKEAEKVKETLTNTPSEIKDIFADAA